MPSQPRNESAEDWALLMATTLSQAKNQSSIMKGLSVSELYHLALDSPLSELDRYSHFLSAHDKALEASRKSSYVGIGATFETTETNQFRLIDLYPGSPADQAGLKSGDIITSLNGWPTRLMPLDLFAARVRGKAGTALTLGIKRENDSFFSVSLTRAPVEPRSAYTKNIGSIAVIRISSFEIGTKSLVKDLSEKALTSNPHAIVLDLTHNPGGALDEAAALAGMMGGPKGSVALVRGRVSEANFTYHSQEIDIFRGLPLFVLIDSKTASAAELLAGSLAQRGRAVLLGSPSFGKWSVQRVSPLPDGGELALTWALFSLPDGSRYPDSGIQPAACLDGEARIKSSPPCPKQAYFPTEKAIKQAFP